LVGGGRKSKQLKRGTRRKRSKVRRGRKFTKNKPQGTGREGKRQKVEITGSRDLFAEREGNMQ